MFNRLLIHAFAAGAAPPGTTVSAAALSLARPQWLAAAAPSFVIVTVAVVWSYRRAAGRYALLMAGLRAALVGLILLATLGPTVRLDVQHVTRRAVLLLFDDSASMAVRDPRSAAADVRRPGLVQDRPTSRPSRTELVRAAFYNRRLDLLGRLGRDADVHLSTFGRPGGVADLDAVDHLTAAGPSTPLGDAVGGLLARARGQAVAAVVLVTDGGSNAGGSPLAAAAATDGVPLLVYGVGVSGARDVIVSDLFAPDVAFVDDAVPVTVRVRGVGLVGQSGRLVLRLGEAVVDQQDVTFDGGEQAVTMHATPTAAGPMRLTAGIAPRPDEATADNNSASARVRVVDGKLKVLLVDSAPRWEFRYLQGALLRDRRVSLHCLLEGADPGVSGAAPYVAAFPATRADLFEHYDLTILGDVDPAGFSAEQVQMLVEFVDRFGGGLLVVPGRRFGLGGYAASPLGKLLPVDAATARANDAARPVVLARTPAGQRSPTLRLGEASDALWAALPPVDSEWSAVAKPGAETLLVEASGRAVMAVQPYGRGQAAIVGTDETWRWRRDAGEAVYATFWGQLVQRLALPHLTGESRQATVTVDRPTLAVGDRLTVVARVYTGGYAPLADPAVPATVTVGGRATPLVLAAVPDEPGVYRGSLNATAAGDGAVKLDRDARAEAAFTVSAASRELAQTAMDEPLLRRMAAASGGAFFREEDLGRLPDAVPKSADVAVSTVEVALWSTPAYFLVMVAVATAEWVVRRVVQLR